VKCRQVDVQAPADVLDVYQRCFSVRGVR
jgi:hypothetical protein